MTFDKLRPGMEVYDVHAYRLGNTTLQSIGVWPVRIISVDAEMQTVQASWNYNRSKTYTRRVWATWRMKPPKLIDTGFPGQQRLAKQGESCT